jgi:hypothetical protein
MDDAPTHWLTRAAESPRSGQAGEQPGRFADRTKRLSRRQESDTFGHYFMPVTWILALTGLLGLGGLWVAEGAGAMTGSAAFPLFTALFTAPAMTWLLRMVRGHFHPAVRNF